MAGSPYDYQHKKRRRQLLPKAYGQPCPYCGHVMVKGQALDLDHSVPVAFGGTVGDRITHASCNRSAGTRVRGTRPDLTGPAW